jgi:uncharacterized protein (TIGR00369 family)
LSRQPWAGTVAPRKEEIAVTLDAWTLKQIQDHIATGLPLARLFKITVPEAGAEHAIAHLGFGELATGPGGSVAGPVQLALADVAIYALILAAKHDPAAVTADLMINFLRHAITISLLATSTPLWSGRHLFTAEARIVEETTTRLVAQATRTYSLSDGSHPGGPPSGAAN